MKFYATVTCTRVVEIEAADYEQANDQAEQRVTELLPDRAEWKPAINVSAVKALGELRYYVRQGSIGKSKTYAVHERQLEYQDRADVPAGIHESDPQIRWFNTDRDSAHCYARKMSELQQELDKHHGLWTKHAVTQKTTAGSQ